MFLTDIPQKMFRSFLVFFLILTAKPAFSQNLDINMLKTINVQRNKDLDPGFKVVTNTLLPVSIAVPVTVLTVALIKKDSSLTYTGLYIAESFLVSSFITTAMKYTFRRERPFESHSFIEQEAHASSPSFPSGHASAAFSTATSLSISFPKWYVIAPAYLWAGTVAYSRMHLGVHYPSDVLAGAVIGSGTALLAHVVNKKIFGKNQQSSKVPLYINLW